MPTASEHSEHEKELIRAFQQGEQRAFTAIYDQYAHSLINFAASRLASLEEARDVIHDLFVHFWEEREGLSIDYSLKAYLFSAVRYRIIDHIRKNMTRRAYAERLQALAREWNVSDEGEAEAKDLHRNLEKAIGRLPPRVQQVYRLSRQQHLSIPEIAEELQISQQTVKNQLTTALGLLRGFLQKLPAIWWL